LRIGALSPDVGLTALLRTRQPPSVPDGAQFLSRSFTCAAGARTYKVYIPASAADRPNGLVVMLHGCKQDPDDFAAGTKMNAIAEARGLAVAYPAQSISSNTASCWNWFNPADQVRGAGEPSIIAGLTGEIVSELNIDPNMVFVAGLSAGGAMAAVMAATYPDLYAAVGIHSGLAFKSANDVVSAFAAMRGERGPTTPGHWRAIPEQAPCQRTIVFQGTADQIVRPSNAVNIVDAASRQHNGAALSRERGDRGMLANRGRRTRMVRRECARLLHRGARP
jgi:poly(hydroxyalkanoate) depolymerase family esterase